MHWRLLCQCALGPSSGGDFGESSGSISNRRDDSDPETEKEKIRINLESCGQSVEASDCTRSRADSGSGRDANRDRAGGREEGRDQPQHGLNSAKWKTGCSGRTVYFYGRISAGRREKKTSTEKARETYSATRPKRDGEHFDVHSDVAFGGTIDGNQRAFA